MLVLLDIDGVMIPARNWKSPELMEDGFPEFSNKAVHALQNLISENTTLLLTTSHKSNYTISQWKEIFHRRKINIKNLQTLPKNVANLSRKDEIITWASLNPTPGDFIIIDDDSSLNNLPPYLKQHLILTTPLIGLIEENIKDVVVI